MVCPRCGSRKVSKVLESRERNEFTYRRRECVNCKYRYITHEWFVKECSDWVADFKPRVLSLNQLSGYDEAVWIEDKGYGGSRLFATQVKSVATLVARFGNGQVRAISLYNKQWRAWTKKPRENDLNTEWSDE